MAFSKQKICHLYTFVMMIMYLRKTTATNIDCGGKPFHCVNSTHFMICVDLGAGVSQTVDDYMIRCPLTTVCLSSNNFECEYRISTTTESTIRPSDVTKESEIKNLLPTDLPSSETSPSTLSNNFNTVSIYTKVDFMTDDTEQPRGILDIDISTVPNSDTALQFLSTTGSYAVDEIKSEVTQMNLSDNIDPLRLPKLSNDIFFYQELTPSPLSTKLEQEPSLPLLNEERVENIGQVNNSYDMSINNVEGFFNDSTTLNIKSTNATFVDFVTELITKDTPYTESLSFTHLVKDNTYSIDRQKYSTNDLLNITNSTDLEDRAETLIESTTEGIKTLDSEKVNETNKKNMSEMYTKSTSTTRTNLPNLTISRATEINQIISPISPLADFSNSNDLGKKPFDEITTAKVLEKSPKDLQLNENIVVEIPNKTDIVLDVTTNDSEALNKDSSNHANPTHSLTYDISTKRINEDLVNIDFQRFYSDTGSTNSNYKLLNLETTTNSFKKVYKINSASEAIETSTTKEIKQSTVSGTNTEALLKSNTDLRHTIMATTKEVDVSTYSPEVVSSNINYHHDLNRESNTGKSLQEIPTLENFNRSTNNLSKVLKKSKVDSISKTNIVGVTINDSESINKNGVLYDTYTEAASKDSTRSDTVNTIIDYQLELSEDQNKASSTINKTGILQGGSMNAKLKDVIFYDTTIKTVIKNSNQTTSNTQSFTDSDTLNTIPTVQSLNGLNTENSMDSLNNGNILTKSTTKTVLTPSEVQMNWPREIFDTTEKATNRILPASDTNLQFKTTHTYKLENLSSNSLTNDSSKRKDLRGLTYQNNGNSFQTLTNPQVNTESTQEGSELSWKFTNSILHTTTNEPINKDLQQIDLQRIVTIPTPPTLFDSKTLVTSVALYNTANSRTDKIDDRTTKPLIQAFSRFDLAPKQRPKIITTTGELPFKNLENQQTKNEKNIKSVDDKRNFYLPYEMNGSTTYTLTSEPTVNLTLVPVIPTTDNATQELDNYTTYKNLNEKNMFSDVQNTAIHIEINPTAIITNKTAVKDFGGSPRGIMQLSLNKTRADSIVPFNKDLFGTISKIKIEPTKEYIFTSPLSLFDSVPAMPDESTTTVTDSGSTTKMQADTINFGRNGLNIISTQDLRPAQTFEALRESITSTSDINSEMSDKTVQINNGNPLLYNNLDTNDGIVSDNNYLLATILKLKEPTEEYVLTSSSISIDTMTTLNHISSTTVTPSSDLTVKMQKDTSQSGKDGLNIFTPEDLPVNTFKALPESITSSLDTISVSTDKTAQKISEPLFTSNNVSDAHIVVPVNDRIFSAVPEIKTKPKKEYVLRSSSTLTDTVTSLKPEEFSTRITVPTDHTLKMQTDTIQSRKYGLNGFSTQDRSLVNKFKTLPESLSSDIISASTDKTAQTQKASELSLKFTNSILHTTTKEPINKDSRHVDLQRIRTIPTLPILFDSLTLVTSGASYNAANPRTDNIDDRTTKPLIQDFSSFDLAPKQRPKIITTTGELPLKNLENQETKNEKNIKSVDDKESLYLPYETNGSTTYALTSEPTVNLSLVPVIPTTDNATQQFDNYTTYKKINEKNMFSDVQNTTIHIEINPTSILTNKTAVKDFGGSTTLRGIMQLSLNKTRADSIVPFNEDLFGTISKIKIEPTKEYIFISPLSLVDSVPAMPDESATTVTDSGSTRKMQADTTNFGRNGLNIISTQDFRPAQTFEARRKSITSTSDINSEMSDKTVQINNGNPLLNNNLDTNDGIVSDNNYLLATIFKLKEPTEEYVLTSTPTSIDTMTTLNHISSTTVTTVTPSDLTVKLQKDTNQSGKNGLNIFTPDLPVNTFKALPESTTSSSDIISVSTDKTAQKISEPLFNSNNVSNADIVVPVNNRIFDTVPKIKTEPNKQYVLRSPPTLTDTVTSLKPEESTTTITLPSDSTLKMLKDTTQSGKDGLTIFATKDLPINALKDLPEPITLSSDIISVSTDKTVQIINERLFTNNNVNDTDNIVPFNNYLMGTISNIKTEPTKEYVLTSPPSSVDTVVPLKHEESTTTVTLLSDVTLKMQKDTIHSRKDGFNIFSTKDFGPVNKFEALPVFETPSPDVSIFTTDKTHGKDDSNILSTQDVSRTNQFKSYQVSEASLSDMFTAATDKTAEKNNITQFINNKISNSVASTVRYDLNSATFSWNKSYTKHLNTDGHTYRLTQINLPTVEYNFEKINEAPVKSETDSAVTPKKAMMNENIPTSSSTVSIQEEVLHPITLDKVSGSLSQTERVFNASELDSYKKGANSVKDNISVTTILTPFKIEELVGNLNIHVAEETTGSMSIAGKVNLQPNIPMFLESITNSSSNANFNNPKDFKRSPRLNSSTLSDDDVLKIRIDKEFIGKNNDSVILSTNDQKPETPRLNNNTRNSAYKMSGNLSKPTFYKSTDRNQNESKTKERVIKTLPILKENNDYNNLLYEKGKHINNSTTKHIMHVATFVSGNSGNQFERVFIAPVTNSTNNYRTDQPLLKPKFRSVNTSNIRQTSKNVNTNRSQSPVNKVQFTCVNRLRGRYADENDCKKFYICIGQIQPLHGECPANTVFSQIKKQCTKNLSHCINNNQFDCIQEGRFVDVLKDNIYYICVKNENSYIRFQFQCQSGYHLNKTSIKCTHNNQYQPITTSSTSIDGDSNKASDQNTVERISKEKKKSKVNAEKNICRNEGKFPDPNDCRRYYVCSKKSKSVFRRRTKKCDSDEVFHREKKKCVSDESYECN